MAPANTETEGTFSWDISNQVKAGGFTDWYLPTGEELDQIYQNLMQKGLGDLKNSFYWSSTTYPEMVLIVNMENGKHEVIALASEGHKKFKYRSVRAF